MDRRPVGNDADYVETHLALAQSRALGDQPACRLLDPASLARTNRFNTAPEIRPGLHFNNCDKAAFKGDEVNFPKWRFLPLSDNTVSCEPQTPGRRSLAKPPKRFMFAALCSRFSHCAPCLIASAR